MAWHRPHRQDRRRVPLLSRRDELERLIRRKEPRSHLRGSLFWQMLEIRVLPRHSPSPKTWPLHPQKQRRSCVAPSSFSFCCCGRCRCRAQQVPVRCPFTARGSRTTDSAEVRRAQLPLRTSSWAVGGAATATRQLASARDRLICVEGGLSGRPLFLSGQSLRCRLLAHLVN
jgi:hypothetical protein